VKRNAHNISLLPSTDTLAKQKRPKQEKNERTEVSGSPTEDSPEFVTQKKRRENRPSGENPGTLHARKWKIQGKPLPAFFPAPSPATDKAGQLVHYGWGRKV